MKVARHPLQKFRAERKWTQAELARFLGVSAANLNRWERRRRQISIRQIPTISEKTGIPPRELRPDWGEIIAVA
jgi:transcriptional regulator with XRE-family HTH domain